MTVTKPMTHGQLGLGLDNKTVGDVQVRRIDLGFLPPSKNVYDSWQPAWKSSAKKKWCQHIADCADQMLLPRGLTKVGLAARLVFPTNARRDPQNYAQTLWHFVPDALVRCGVLVDDADGMIDIGPNWGIEMVVDGRSHVDKKKRKRTVLTLAYQLVEGQCHDCMTDPVGVCIRHRLGGDIW